MNIIDLVTKKLTKTGVAGPDKTQWFDSPADAVHSAVDQEQRTVEPGTSEPINVQIPLEAAASFLQSDHPLASVLRGESTIKPNDAGPVEPPTPAAQDTSSGYAQQAPEVSQLPGFLRPSYAQASSDPYGNPRVTPALTKKGALLTILRGGLEGGLAAAGTQTAGEGFAAASAEPFLRAQRAQAIQRGNLENQITQAQIQMLPWQRAATIAALGKTQAEADKARAEASRLPAQQALDEANALKAQFQVVDGVPYQIVKPSLPWQQPTLQPVDGSAMIPLSPELAKLANKQPGDNVPITQALKLADLATKGTTNYTTGEGVFEKNRVTGKTTRLGTAPAIASINLQQGPYLNPTDASGNINPKLKPIIDSVGNYQMPLTEALSRVPPAGKAGFLTALKQAYPDFDQKTYEAAQKTLNSATSGPLGDQLSAYNTAILHANLLKQAAKAIAQHDMPALNALENSFQTEFGESAPLTFDALAHLYTGETTKVVSGGHITDTELGKTGATLGRNNSPKQIMDVLNAYSKAMQSKRDVTRNRIQQAMKGNVAYDGPNEQGVVQMKAPNGQIKPVPADQVEHYKQLGATVVNQTVVNQ